MSAGIEDQIKRAATAAKDLLGQLGPLVWALHSRHDCVALVAAALSEDPDAHVRICVPDAGDRIRKQAVADIRTLTARTDQSRKPKLFSSSGLREVINRNIVVYAVAVLEEFLDRAAAALGVRDDHWPADTLCKVEHLRKEHCVDLRKVNSYVNTGWLVLVRNAVIHNAGFAPTDIADDAGRYKLCKRWRLDKDADGNEILVWDGQSPQSRKCMAGKALSIAIDQFILPQLRDAQAFVGEAEQVLLKSLNQS